MRGAYPLDVKAPTPTPARRKSLFTVVFEVVNPARREIYVGTAGALPEGALIEPRLLSPRLSHWQPGESLEIRLVEPRMPAEHCADFISGYAETVRRAGWTAVTDL